MIRGDKKNISVTMTPDLLAEIDVRAGELDMNRSQYLRFLARQAVKEHKSQSETEAKSREVAA